MATEPPKPVTNFKFNFSAVAAPVRTSENSDQQSANLLKDEKKFIVNKDLFANPFLKTVPFKLNETSETTKVDCSANPMVEKNPLNSTASLAVLKKSLSLDEDDAPPVKSLFDFQQNKKYLKTDENGGVAFVPTFVNNSAEPAKVP